MKSIYLILLIFSSVYSFSQEQNKDWINLIDISSYKVYKKTNKLNKVFLEEIETERKDIANSNGKFSKGCTDRGKHIRLNWIAIDEKEHQIISMSYGGRAYYTKYYIIDYETGKMNLRLIRIVSSNRELNFKQVVNSINENKYE
jgi:hypothetical protein